MKLITLTKKYPYGDKPTICINTAHIVAFFATDENESTIKIIGEDEWMVVTESPDEVMRRIQFAKEF